MKSSLTLAVLAAALFSGTAASGADINGSLKDGADVFSAPKEVNWTGFYVGVQGGYGNANHNLSVQDYFKDYCADSWDAENPEFDRFDNNDRKDTLENINKGIQSWDAPDWVKAAKLRTDCATRAGGTEPGVEINPRVIDTTPSRNTVAVAGDSRELGSIDGVNSHGFIGGGRIGFDYARGRLLFGAFADYNFSGMETNASVAGIGNFDLRKEDEWTIGGRIGYIVAPRTLAYVLAGYTQTEYSVGGLDNAVIAPLFTSVRSGATFDGVTVGGGIEFALAANVFFGLEYQHTFYGEETLIDAYNADLNQGIKVIDDLDEDKIMATLKIKLNGLGLD
jgi:opacity protein-like surface antigen